MTKESKGRLRRWAELRFSIIGGLLANPPSSGELGKELEKLALKQYRHPTKDAYVRFGVSTIERWYYKAIKTNDPIDALGRKVRSDRGVATAMNSTLLSYLKRQYEAYPNWSYKLHADNLSALAAERGDLGDAPSYATVRRRMKEHGWYRKKTVGGIKTPGRLMALDRLEKREVRSYESPYVNGLWHLDFHEGKRVLDIHGKWHSPKALCVIDDHSRLCCHIQWYLNETAEVLFHGLLQAFHKRGLPRSLMTDNGSAMIANETRNGLLRLGITHDTTLPYSPYQNGKQEAFWGQLEGRLITMLSRVEPLTLSFLNQTSQAWIEMEYNRKPHEETKEAPIERFLKGKNVSRPSPETDSIRLSFTVSEIRTQRKSDGTIQVNGVRFEIPSRFRHYDRLNIRYQSWDLSRVYLMDEKTQILLAIIYPQDKTKNANSGRRALKPKEEILPSPQENGETIPPLLRKLLSDYAATGLPPAYLPQKNHI